MWRIEFFSSKADFVFGRETRCVDDDLVH